MSAPYAKTSIQMLLTDDEPVKHSLPTPAPTPFSPTDAEKHALQSQLDSVSASLKNQPSYAFISHSPSTFLYKQPTIDNLQLARRKRRRTSAHELSVLEYEFRRCPKPSRIEREIIAQQVGMTEKAVQIWFQNKRQSHRRNQMKQEMLAERELEVPFLSHREPMMRRSSSDSDDSSRSEPCSIYVDPVEQPDASALRSPPKMLRLSMNMDGKAELVVTKSNSASIAAPVVRVPTPVAPVRMPTPLASVRSLTPVSATAPTPVMASVPMRIPTPVSTDPFLAAPVPRQPLQMASASLLNRQQTLPPPDKMTSLAASKPMAKSCANSVVDSNTREAECISNLLSLRSGIWN